MPSPSATSNAPDQARNLVLPAWLSIVILLTALTAPLWHLHIINRGMPPNKADMVAVWKGAQATFAGQNPYLDATTRDIQIFYYGRPVTTADHVNPMGYAYPMHTIILFAPLALLSWPVARLACLILLTLLTAASVPLWFSVAGLQPGRKRLIVTTFLVLCSWPSMWAIHQIQPSLLVAALVAAGCFLVSRGNQIPAGISSRWRPLSLNSSSC